MQDRLKMAALQKAQVENFPPTTAVIPAIVARAHHEAIVWYNNVVSMPKIPPPVNYGWNSVSGLF